MLVGITLLAASSSSWVDIIVAHLLRTTRVSILETRESEEADWPWSNLLIQHDSRTCGFLHAYGSHHSQMRYRLNDSQCERSEVSECGDKMGTTEW